MGNHHSGRRYFVGAKATVEDCRSIDIVRWARKEGLAGGRSIPARGNGTALERVRS